MTTLFVSFGSTKIGLATVGYRWVDAAGAVGARLTAGVVEAGGGGYSIPGIAPPIGSTAIQWDTGETIVTFAHEDLNLDFVKKVLINRRETDPNTGVQSIFENDDSTVLVQGDLFEDIAGTTPYSSTSDGIDRQDRLV